VVPENATEAEAVAAAWGAQENFEPTSSVSSMAANTSMAPTDGSDSGMAVENAPENTENASSNTSCSRGSGRRSKKAARLRANTTGSTNFSSSGSASSSSTADNSSAETAVDMVNSSESMQTAVSQAEEMQEGEETTLDAVSNTADAPEEADASNAEAAGGDGSGEANTKAKSREGVSLLDDEQVEKLFSKMTTSQREQWNTELQAVVKGLVS
jgi:hypothetical protein